MKEEKRNIPEVRFREFAGDNADAWELRKLGEVADIVGGGTPKTNISEYWNGDIEWYSPIEIGEQIYVRTSQKKITKLGLYNSSAKLLPIGTILFTSRAGIGNTAILAKEGATNQGFQSIVPNKNILNSYFIYSRSQELKRYGEKNGAGSTFIEVSGKQMAKMPMYFPKLQEQQKIGNFFKHLDSLITLHQRELDNLKALKKTLLSKMFPKNDEKYPEIRFSGFTDAWELRKLGDIVSWKKGTGLTKAELNSNKNGNEVIHYADLYKFSPVIFNVIHWSKKSEGTIIPDNSLLFPMSDVTPLGLARVSAIVRNGVRAGSDILIATVDKKHIAQFLSYEINAQHKKIIPFVTGTTVRHINAGGLAKLNIMITSSKEQQKIGTFFKHLDELIALHQRELDNLKVLKKTLLSKMFV